MREFQFRRALRRLKRRKPEYASVIDQAFANAEILAEACAYAEEGFEGHLAASNAGPFMDFLSWVLENGPAIIDFITKLIALFTATA